MGCMSAKEEAPAGAQQARVRKIKKKRSVVKGGRRARAKGGDSSRRIEAPAAPTEERLAPPPAAEPAEAFSDLRSQLGDSAASATPGSPLRRSSASVPLEDGGSPVAARPDEGAAKGPAPRGVAADALPEVIREPHDESTLPPVADYGQAPTQPPSPRAEVNPLAAPRLFTTLPSDSAAPQPAGVLFGRGSSSRLTSSTTTTTNRGGGGGGGNSSSMHTASTADDESRRASTASTLTRKRKSEMTAEELHAHRLRKQNRHVQLWVQHAFSGPDDELDAHHVRSFDPDATASESELANELAGLAELGQVQPLSDTISVSADSSCRASGPTSEIGF